MVITQGGQGGHSRQHSLTSQHSGRPAQISVEKQNILWKLLEIFYCLFGYNGNYCLLDRNNISQILDDLFIFICFEGDVATGDSGDVEEDLWTTWGGSGFC